MTNSPDKWKRAFEAGAPAATCITELGQARAYELLMRLGSDTPLWSGVITVQHEYLLRWGELPAANTTTTFKNMRAIMNAHARVIWRNRCEIVYSPENEKRRVEKQLRREAITDISDMGVGSRVTVEQILRMTPRQKVKLRQQAIGEWKEQTRQPTIQQMKGFTVTNRAQKTPTKTNQPRTIIPRTTLQQTITKQGTLGPTTDEFHTETSQHKTQKKYNNNQLTLTEIWKIPTSNNNKIKKRLQRQTLGGNSTHTTFKRVRRKRNNECMMCKEGGKLIECHTCTSTCHIICDNTMPTNVRHQEVVWRCQNCVNTEGNTECRVAKWADGHRQKHDEKLKDEWNNQHSWVGKTVEKMFDSAMYTGTITHWLPDSKTEWELWRIHYEDGDMEELDILELLPILKDHTKRGDEPKAPTPTTTKNKRDLTRKDKRRERKRRRQRTHAISDHDTLTNG